jgi:hypothetical protein
MWLAGMPQSSAELYRANAKSCAELARKVVEAESRIALLDMARAWLALAEQAEKNSATTSVYETPEPLIQPAQQQQQPQPNDPETKK